MHKKNCNLPVHPRYLKTLDEQQFWHAYGELRDIFEDFYRRAVEYPESTSLPLYRLDEHDFKTKEAKAGRVSLLNLSVVLLAISLASVWENNALVVSHACFKAAIKSLKGAQTTEQIQRFCDNGFVFSNWNGKKFLPCDTFKLDYPDNPNILAVIAAIGDKFDQYRQAQEKILGLEYMEQFIQFDPRIFADDSGTLPPKTFIHMIDTFTESNRQLYYAIVDKFKERELELKLNAYFGAFYNSKGKDTLNNISFGHYSVGIRENEPLTLRLKLIRISQYINKIETLPSHLRVSFENVKCFNCSEKCTRKVRYSLGGKSKIACACDTFVFRDYAISDLDTLMALFDAEEHCK